MFKMETCPRFAAGGIPEHRVAGDAFISNATIVHQTMAQQRR
jgi:hypothetical protein